MTPPHIISAGSELFMDALRAQGVPVTRIAWKPPAHGDETLIGMLFRLTAGFRDGNGVSLVDSANEKALRRILAANPVLIGVRPAAECVPILEKGDILLHAGPPIDWPDMCGPMRGALVGALMYEGLAASVKEAAALLDRGAVRCVPTRPCRVVAPMAGVVSRSMPLFIVKDTESGNIAYAPINEGVGHVLRFGAHTPGVIRRLHWISRVLAPVLDGAVRSLGGVHLKPVMAQALGMGDELHQRNTAASMLFQRTVDHALTLAAPDRDEESEIRHFLSSGNDQFFLNLAMAASRVAMDCAQNIFGSSLITSMSRNGASFGIQISHFGERLFCAPCNRPRALYFPGFNEADACPDMGDSAIVECYGLGGLAMGASPAVARFLRAGTLKAALSLTRQMRHICVGQNPDLPLPNAEFEGTPTGIDVRLVAATGILPVINSGVAHIRSGVGQVGAGYALPPPQVMHQAIAALLADLEAHAPPPHPLSCGEMDALLARQ